jgi:hypothetical protein
MPKKKPDNVVQLPPDWKSAFQGHAMRTSFCLALTQPMLEFLCATADGVHWDRRLYCQQWGAAKPDNWIASGSSLVNRGLIERLKPGEYPQNVKLDDMHMHSHYRVTPAGAAIVELLRVTGIFVEADASVEKRARGAK